MTDRLHKVSWEAGHVLLHGTSEKYLKEAAVQFLRQANVMKVEYVDATQERAEAGAIGAAEVPEPVRQP